MQRELKNWLKAYMQYTRHLEAPDTFHFWAGIATIAGALEGRVWIDMGYWKWKPNFFVIFVAPPGVVSKSFTIGVGEQMLREVEGIHFGPNSVTWQALTLSFLEATKRIELPDKTEIQMSAITITASELGTFIDPTNREMIDVLVDLWDGREVPWARKTKGEGDSSIPNPWLNFIGATTPAWMAENFPEYAIGGGFTSRTVFVYADKKRRYTAYPIRVKDSNDDKIRVALVRDLRKIALMVGQFEISDEAYKWGEEWYHEHWTGIKSGVSTRMAGYKARKQTHIHKLAMILSAAESDELIITKENLEQASILMTALEIDMPRVFTQVADNPRAKYAAAVFTAVKARGTLSRQELWRDVFHIMSHREFEEALDGAFRAGYIKIQQTGGSMIISLKEKQEMH